jgi:hypothetical protein
MIYFLILQTRKFIHTHCIKPLGLLNANTCDHPRCPLLFFNPYSLPPSYTLFLFCTLQFGCISIGWFVSTPDLFLVFALHFLIFASLLMFPCLYICVWKVHKTPGWWLTAAATCHSERGQQLSTNYDAITLGLYNFITYHIWYIVILPFEHILKEINAGLKKLLFSPRTRLDFPLILHALGMKVITKCLL